MLISKSNASFMALALLCGACSQGAEDAPAEEAAGMAADTQGNGPPPPPDDAAAAELAPASTAAPAVIDGITNQRLSFESGQSSARIQASITGYEIVDYLLNVRSGQAMNISMATSNAAAYFNLLEPGETEVAVFNGSIGENMFEGVAAKSGDYRIRVYLMRSAARREETANYTLEVAVQ